MYIENDLIENVFLIKYVSCSQLHVSLITLSAELFQSYPT